MKKTYIRTPNEIYDLDDLYVCEELNGKPYGVKDSGFCIYKESIIKQGNTIEELCDQFLIFDEDKNFLLAYNNFSNIKLIWENRENRLLYVYGAIRV